MSGNKLERLLKLTAVLLETPVAISAEDLRRKVEGYPDTAASFHRIFERDKQDLRLMGVPLLVEEIVSGSVITSGYRIEPDDYYLPDPGLEPQELVALHLASALVNVDNAASGEALQKLGGVETESDNQHSATTQVATLPSDPALTVVFEAIVAGKTLEFGYKGEKRKVKPWRLDFQRGHWYLTAFDVRKGAERNFRLDRVDSTMRVLSESATTDVANLARQGSKVAVGERPLRPWEMGDSEQVTATLLVDASRVESAKTQLAGSSTPRMQPDGSAIFQVQVRSFDAFRFFVLGFLERAELLEPQGWRNEMIDWLQALAGDQSLPESKVAQ